MHLDEIISTRRSIRSLEKTPISRELIEKLAYAASMAPSCYNKQPWNYIFVTQEDQLNHLYTALARGNEWGYQSSLIIAVYAKTDDDCILKDREYYLFDTGMSSAFLMLKAVEEGLSVHPIAGFDAIKAKSILGIPDEYKLITLIICGKKSDQISESLNEDLKHIEFNRPPRKTFHEFCHLDKR